MRSRVAYASGRRLTLFCTMAKSFRAVENQHPYLLRSFRHRYKKWCLGSKRTAAFYNNSKPGTEKLAEKTDQDFKSWQEVTAALGHDKVGVDN